MSKNKALGFYDFHITAEKARDFFLKNDFSADGVTITAIEPGQKLVAAGNAVKPKAPVNKHGNNTHAHHHSIASFFKHLLHMEGKDGGDTTTVDRTGFILSVTTTSAEQLRLASEILKSHGARHVKEFSS